MESANQRYKQSGSSLKFTEWLNREKQKGVVIPKQGVTDVYNKTIKEIEEIEVKKEEQKPQKKYSLEQKVFLLSGIIILSAIAYRFYKTK